MPNARLFENFEMKTQLGLPPHRRLMLLSEPDPEKTISDADLRKQREASDKAPSALFGFAHFERADEIW